MKTYKGRVIKAVASKFFVDTDDGVKVCFARKRLKNDGLIYVGDYVEIAKDRDNFVIENVAPRKIVLFARTFLTLTSVLSSSLPNPNPISCSSTKSS